MTALEHVWVRGVTLELARADQIIALAIEEQTEGTDGAALVTAIPETKKSPAANETRFALTATLAGRAGSFLLRNYRAADAVEAIGWLAKALAKTAGRGDPVLFVYPTMGDEADWEIQPSLPREWII